MDRSRAGPRGTPGSRRSSLAGLARLASKYHASLVTTDKDLVRLPAGSGLPLVALRIEAVVHDEERLMRLVREAIAGGRA